MLKVFLLKKYFSEISCVVFIRFASSYTFPTYIYCSFFPGVEADSSVFIYIWINWKTVSRGDNARAGQSDPGIASLYWVLLLLPGANPHHPLCRCLQRGFQVQTYMCASHVYTCTYFPTIPSQVEVDWIISSIFIVCLGMSPRQKFFLWKPVARWRTPPNCQAGRRPELLPWVHVCCAPSTGHVTPRQSRDEMNKCWIMFALFVCASVCLCVWAGWGVRWQKQIIAIVTEIAQ